MGNGVKSDSTVHVLEEPSGSQEGSRRRAAAGVLQAHQAEWWERHSPSQGGNFEGQCSLGCVTSIGRKTIASFIWHHAWHCTK